MLHPIKNSSHRKKQENIVHNEQVNQLIKTYKQLTQMLELVDKAIKMVIITVLLYYMCSKSQWGHGRYKRNPYLLLQIKTAMWIRLTENQTLQNKILRL